MNSPVHLNNRRLLELNLMVCLYEIPRRARLESGTRKESLGLSQYNEPELCQFVMSIQKITRHSIGLGLNLASWIVLYPQYCW